jgi:hypothetical protein
MRRPVCAQSLAALLVASSFAYIALGCVSNELHSVKAARTEYENCVAEYSASHRNCETLREVLIEDQRRYEDNSRRTWSCDPQLDECPTPR